jgi:enoyl-CoA hydratase/carnithine racemase
MPHVNYKMDGSVGVITLAKPPHNLLDNKFIAEIIAGFTTAVEEGCRSILLQSSMRHFCAGADLDVIKAERHDQAGLEAIWRALEDIPIPSLAAVHGAALGGGLELALMCDMVIAADTASIGMAEATLGLLPLLGGVQRVVQRAGVARAKEMAMFGRRNDPRALERWNVINLVVPESELDSVALSWAKQLASGATVALRAIKKVANLAAREGIAGADAAQAIVNETIWTSADHERGLAAFATTGPASAVFQGD